jgi:hypothetical protein
MPADDSKTYQDIKGKLENLSVGIKKHAADENYPTNISTATVEAKLASLIQKRTSYDEAESIARQKYSAYSVEFDECEKLFSSYSTQLYGFHGKQNLVVADYGLKTYQKPTGRKTKTSSDKTA